MGRASGDGCYRRIEGRRKSKHSAQRTDAHYDRKAEPIRRLEAQAETKLRQGSEPLGRLEINQQG